MTLNKSSLQQDYYKILMLQRAEPDISLLLCRKLLERLCSSICLSQNLLSKEELQDSNLSNWLLAIKRDYKIPKLVLAHAWSVKEYGNCAAHDHNQFNNLITPKYAEPCIKSLELLIEWYTQNIAERD